MLDRLVSHATPGARLAYWNMLVPRGRPESMADRLRPLTELSTRLLLRGGGGDTQAMTHPLLGMALVLLTLGALLAALTLYRRVGAPHPELLRKLLHVGMGLTTLLFPFLFVSLPMFCLLF